MAAIDLQYPNTDDFEMSGAGSGPVQIKPIPPKRPAFKLEQSLTFYGDQQRGNYIVIKNNFTAEELTQTARVAGFVFTQVIDNSVASREPVNAKMADKLASIYKLDANENTRRIALDLIVDYLDDWLNEGRFDKCNTMLLTAEPDRLSDPALVTFLGITRAAKHNPAMFGRSVFFRRAHKIVEQRRSEDGADKLLTRYR